MKKVILAFAFSLISASLLGQNIVPKPVECEVYKDNYQIPEKLDVYYGSLELQPVADYLKQELAVNWGVERVKERMMTRRTSSKAKGVRLLIDTQSELPSEGYLLEVGGRGVLIKGADYGGVFNGIQTLLQLLQVGADGKVVVSHCRVFDYPRFTYRGMHLDVARTFTDKEGVLRFIDNISRHKLNKFHWHLTDDEGWRIEIKSHPELAEKGGYRGGDSPIDAIYGEWDCKYGGYYTQRDIKEVIKYAAVRNVEIIPEIEFPGHSRAVARVYPNILCSGPVDTISTAGYDRRDVWCASKDENYTIIDDILREVSELFPSKYIHVGGDEVNMSQWKSCPECKSLMEREKLADGHQLECWFMARVEEILAKYGKTPGVWNEAVNGGSLSKKSMVYGWENTEACLKAVAEGFSTIVMPGSYFYFDMKYTKDEPGMTWAGLVSTEHLYSFDFAKEGFDEEAMKRVVGVEGAFWSELYLSCGMEYLIPHHYLDRQTYPRICALAEVAWTPQNMRDWNDFSSRMESAHYNRLSDLGINYRTEPSPPVNINRIYPKFTFSSSVEAHVKSPYSILEEYKGQARTARTCVVGDNFTFTFENPVDCAYLEVVTGYSYLRRCIIPSGCVEVWYEGEDGFKLHSDMDNGIAIIKPTAPVKAVRLVSASPRNGESTVIIQSPKVVAK